MKCNKTILSNGARLLTVLMKDNPTVTVLVMVETGSEYERKAESGISHFLEHLCFKGTKRRPKSIDISHELDSIGAEYNAFTGHEYTGYYAKADSKHFEKILDVVSDLYLHPVFPAEDVEREKGVIVEEINMYEDMPAEQVHDAFARLVYGDQPAGWSIAGTKKSVRAISHQAVINYRKRHYTAKATTVVIAGSFNEPKAKAAVKQIFSVMPKAAKVLKPKVREFQTKPALSFTNKQTDQTHLVIGARTFDTYHKDQPSLSVLATILGRGMSSRLFVKMREELGICYYAKAGNEAFTDHGYLAVRAGVDKDRLVEAIEAILAELRKLKSTTVGKEELAKAKEFISGKLFLNLESSDDLADFYGFQETIKHELLLPSQYLSRIEKVTAADIKRVAKKIFVNSGINLALVGSNYDQKAITSIFKL
jgi:predicted Zn-dependent peptidase